MRLDRYRVRWPRVIELLLLVAALVALGAAAIR